MDEQAVIISFKYGKNDLKDLRVLEDKIQAVLNTRKLGEFDGDEIAVDLSDGFLYIYGPDGMLIFESIKKILIETDFMKGAQVRIRFGPPEPGIKEEIKNI